MLPFILLMFLLSRWSGGLVDRYGARRPLVVGPIIVAAGFALFALPGIGGGYWTTYFPAVMVLGVGMAISVAPLTTTVMNSVPVEHAGTVSGINNAVSRLAGLLAVAVLGVVMLAVFNRNLASGLVRLDLDSETRLKIENQREKLAAIHVPEPIESEKKAEIEKTIDESFLAGFRIVMLSASVLSLLSAGAAWISIKGTQNPHATTSASETSPLPVP
jgi:MFS family permease